MTRRRNQLLGALAAALFTFLSVRAETLTDGLLAYYPFDGNAIDATGHGFNGTTFKTESTSDRFGNTNAALAFDGDLSFVDCGNPPEFNFAGSFSIAAWVKLNGAQVNKYIVAKYDFGNSLRAYGLGTGAFSNPYAFLKGIPPSFQDIPNSGTALNDDQWHFLTMIYNTNSGLWLYQDGGLIGSFQLVGYPPFTDAAPLQIGKTFSGQPFGGAIDEVRIYNRALTPDEVAQLGPVPVITIYRQPRSATTTVSARVTLDVGAQTSGNQIRRYQWFQNGSAIAGATNNSLVVTHNVAGDDIYKVQVTSGVTTVFSDEVHVIFNPPAPAQLLAQYTFETGDGGIVPDETGKFPGVAVSTTYVAGREGARAIHFDGSSSYVRIPYPDSLLTLAGSPYTIAFWAQSGSVGRIIGMGDGFSTNSGYNIDLGQAFGSTFVIDWMHGSGIEPTMQFRLRAPPTNWTHFAFVWNGATRSLFVNGMFATNVITTNSISSDGLHDLFLGANNGTNLFFRGSLDDVRIYNYALAAEEIAQIAASAVPATLDAQLDANGVLLRWPYDSIATFRIESATTLDAGGDWAPLAALPQRSDSGTNYSVIEPTAGGIRFFRLRKL